MKKIYINLRDRDSIVPPLALEQALYREFDSAINTEWYYDSNTYETIFYYKNKEYIAYFDSEGNLKSYKINLPLAEAPQVILNAVKSDKELMNVVEIHSQKQISYEVILRDLELTRYVAFIDPAGNISEEKPL